MLQIDERPQSFDEFVGNESVVKSVQKDLLNTHVFLFHGPSGCGKTTLARICAGVLGAFDFGIIEKNISNENGVDDARALIETLPMSTLGGGIKVLILDEVDKASDSWQAAMKKPLEDIPKHVYIFLCTENIKKIRSALQTRSAMYELKSLLNDDIKYLLKKIIRKYDLEVEEKIVTALVESSKGSARSAVVKLEQVLGLEIDEALEVLETGEESPEIRELCKLLLNGGTWKEVATVLKGLKEEPESIRRSVLGYMNAVLLNSGKSKAFEIIDVFSDDLFSSGKSGLTRMCYELIN